MTFRQLLAASAFMASVLFGQAAFADELVEEYNAYIGQDDLYNSNNERLREPWQIIRQDRANYHKFGVSQPGDENDRFFTSANNRALAERMIRSGTMTRDARRLLVNGDVRINVQVYRGDDGDYLQITVD